MSKHSQGYGGGERFWLVLYSLIRLEFREVGEVPEVEVGGAGYFNDFFVVDAVSVVGGHVIVGMAVGMIPDDGDVTFRERSVVAAAYRTVPGTVIRLELQAVFLHIVFEPFAESGMGLGVEIDHMFRFRLVVVAADHVEVDVAFYF